MSKMTHFSFEEEQRFKQIFEDVGGPADWEHPSQYFQRLKAETKNDDVLISYLSWKTSQPVRRLPFQSPEDWLGDFSTLDYSDEQALISIRCALSFGEVNYLRLASDSSHGDLYMVISDPAALGPLELDRNIDVHPALLRLSFKDIKPDRPIPTFVMPVGRMLQIPDPYGRPDLDTMEVVGDLLRDNTGPIEDFYMSAWRSIYGIPSKANALPDHALRTQAYIKEIATKLAKGLQIADLRKDQDLEGLRNKAWRAVLDDPRSCRDTNYVVVVDAVDPNHPVWLIRSRNQLNEEGEWTNFEENTSPFENLNGLVFDAAQIFQSFSEWIQDYYHESVNRISLNIEETYINSFLTTVHTADAQQYEREKMLFAAKSWSGT